MPAPCLQSQSVLCGGGFRYFASATMPLSVKSFAGGTARYRTTNGSFAVDEESWLVLNDQEPYTIEFDSKTLIRSTVIFFPSGWAESLNRVFSEPDTSLLDAPEETGSAVNFLQTVSPDNGQIKSRLMRIDNACRGRTAPTDWLEEQLQDLLGTLLFSQKEHLQRAQSLPAANRATRDELYRRLCRGRDYLHATALQAPSLEDAAKASSLSPFHFQRSFKAAFGQSPRQYTESRRLRHARRLLATGATTATQVALEVGYESYSSFHAAYRRHFGHPPSKTL
ncbi:AraC family transcriptional regulator [Pelagicoccus sp. SDUM812002]|uniref:AraC family transcriptional regulator n=1 Tax=Pelagicoccus sp. SDUM812002 TaxID=3041266 RepID=UPI00280D3495|nr:AraC family transcriptional regulator [Pelagicoccus sp. SDUM812002]MDQ8188037.1 AraC family transcriptional regulator [Pelagicoccus sp. SDUM812002]